MKQYDYLIVGAGLYGAVAAHELTKKGKSCLVIDRRDHIAGNVYTEEIEEINVHTFSIPPIKKSGITSIRSQNSTTTSTHRLQSIKMNCTIFHLT